MKESLFFKDEFGREFRLSYSPSEIEIHYCHRGSLSSANSDTECGHTISGDDLLQEFLDKTGYRTIEDLVETAGDFNSEQWQSLHKQIQTNQTSSYLWD